MEEVNLQPASLLQNDTANFEGLHHFLPHLKGTTVKPRAGFWGAKSGEAEVLWVETGGRKPVWPSSD